MDPQQSMPSMSLPPINGSNGGDQNSQVNADSTDNVQTTPPMQDSEAAIPSQQPLLPSAKSTGAPLVAAPHIADDVDLIEKEWVNKIREVIQATTDDPYERSRQLTILKNEYLQKRYQRVVEPS